VMSSTVLELLEQAELGIWHRPACQLVTLAAATIRDLQADKEFVVTGEILPGTRGPEQLPDGHAGDCTIYASLHNGNPTDGVCTCGYGWRIVRATGDHGCMFSEERKALLNEWRESDE